MWAVAFSEYSSPPVYRVQVDMTSTRYHVQGSYASRWDVREDLNRTPSWILKEVKEVTNCLSVILPTPVYGESEVCVCA